MGKSDPSSQPTKVISEHSIVSDASTYVTKLLSHPLISSAASASVASSALQNRSSFTNLATLFGRSDRAKSKKTGVI